MMLDTICYWHVTRHGAALLAAFVLAGSANALDLLGAYRIAVGADPNYLAARATADAAREALPQAKAGLLPQFSASAARSRNNTDQTTQGTLGGPNLTRSFDYAAKSSSLNFRQPLVRLSNLASYYGAEAQVAAADATLEKDFQALALRLTSVYFDVLVAREKLSSVTTQKEAYVGQLAAAERLVATGFGTRIEIDETKARLDITGAQEIDERRNLDVAERSLSGVLNQRIQSGVLARIDTARLKLEMPREADLTVWIALAEEKNPELRAMRANIEVAEREVDKGRAAHLPTLDLVASLSNNDSDSNNIIGSKYVTSSVGVQISIPLFAGGQIDSTVRQARANLEKARQQYEAGRRQLEVEVAKEFGAVQQGIARVRALEQALRSSEQALLSSRKGVEAGTRNSIDVLNALQQISSVQYELAKARYNYALDRLRLKFAAGTLGEEDIVETNGWMSH
ncbi:MAG: TolC family outer membrane protein [Burkholderiales bacterium]